MQDVIREYENMLAERKTLKKILRKKNTKLKNITKDISAHIEAIDILTEAGRKIHSDIIRTIESVITLSIRYVYERPFDFKLIYETKRNNIEARPVVIEGNDIYDDLEEDFGGGFINIASTSWKIALWFISENKTRNIFFFDEPFHWTGDLIEKAGYMLKYMSRKLNFKALIISHDERLISACDKIYRVTHDGRESFIKLIRRRIKRRDQ